MITDERRITTIYRITAELDIVLSTKGVLFKMWENIDLFITIWDELWENQTTETPAFRPGPSHPWPGQRAKAPNPPSLAPPAARNSLLT